MTKDTIEQKALSDITVGGLSLNFQRTCRVPEGQVNSLPAGMGSFPLFKTEDFKSGVPKDWNGYFMPMYVQEAMWISFARNYHTNPYSLIVGAGSINAVTGKQMPKDGKDFLMSLEETQNYLVVPPQPWIDGWKDKDGKIYQFVAALMGSGETVEGQITGEEKFGGIQLGVFHPKMGQNLAKATRPNEYMTGGNWNGYPYSGEEILFCMKGVAGIDSIEEIAECASMESLDSDAMMLSASYDASSLKAPKYRSLVRRSAKPEVKKIRSIQAMGLGRGGEIEQKIYPDPYGLKVWEDSPAERIYIYMVDEESFKQITGHRAPPTPVTYEKYQQYGLPWFELHDKKLKDTSGSDIFSKLKTVIGKKGKKTEL